MTRLIADKYFNPLAVQDPYDEELFTLQKSIFGQSSLVHSRILLLSLHFKNTFQWMNMTPSWMLLTATSSTNTTFKTIPLLSLHMWHPSKLPFLNFTSRFIKALRWNFLPSGLGSYYSCSLKPKINPLISRIGMQCYWKPLTLMLS